jgi:hypothetical protein
MSFPTRLARAIAIGLLGLSLAGCESDGGTSGGPGAPVIGNPNFTFGGACTTGAGAGTSTRLTMSFSDVEGNVAGGVATIATTFDQQATSVIVDVPIPSANATISGTTTGVITLIGCVTFGTASSITQEVTVTDASGKTSNELSLTAQHPPRRATPTDAGRHCSRRGIVRESAGDDARERAPLFARD